MLASALNFAAGFWGIPYENQYLQSITIEDRDVRLRHICAEELNQKLRDSLIIPLPLT
jgi:hypothetical protein